MSSFRIFILASLLLICSAVGNNKHNRNNNMAQQDRIWRSKKAICESSTCSHFNAPEAYNCINECVSKKCYTSVYSANPLEDGEIDNLREREFIKCIRLEQKEMRDAVKSKL